MPLASRATRQPSFPPCLRWRQRRACWCGSGSDVSGYVVAAGPADTHKLLEMGRRVDDGGRSIVRVRPGAHRHRRVEPVGLWLAVLARGAHNVIRGRRADVAHGIVGDLVHLRVVFNLWWGQPRILGARRAVRQLPLCGRCGWCHCCRRARGRRWQDRDWAAAGGGPTWWRILGSPLAGNDRRRCSDGGPAHLFEKTWAKLAGELGLSV